MKLKYLRMNKFKFILSLAGITLLTSCTSDEIVAGDDNGLTPQEETAIVIEAGQNSDVPISLGSGGADGAMTRGLINPDAHGLFSTEDGKYLGVFCLAQQCQQPEGTPISELKWGEDIKWAGGVKYAVWMENIPARVQIVNSGTHYGEDITDSNAFSDVTFYDPESLASTPATPATKTYYYPFGNWYNYYFYGYYPYVSSGVTKTANEVIVDLELDGKTDVLHGITIPDNSDTRKSQAYCAKYFRDKKKDAEDAGTTYSELNTLPTFQMKHMLSQFRFYVRAIDADAAQKLFTNNFKLKELNVQNVFKKWQLVVAARTTSSYSTGDWIIKDGTLANGRETFSPVIASDDTNPFASGGILIAENASDLEPKEVGYVLVPTSEMLEKRPEGPDRQYYIKLTYTYTNSDVEFPVEEPILIPAPAGGFLAGKVYNIILDVIDPTEVHARAVLEGWDQPNVNDEDDQNVVVPIL